MKYRRFLMKGVCNIGFWQCKPTNKIVNSRSTSKTEVGNHTVSPKLFPSDCHLFGLVKEGNIFARMKNVKVKMKYAFICRPNLGLGSPIYHLTPIRCKSASRITQNHSQIRTISQRCNCCWGYKGFQKSSESVVLFK